MANFVPKLGTHTNLPAVSEGSFLITTDEKEIYVDTSTGRKLISNGKQEVEYIVGTQNSATNVWTGVTKDTALYAGKVIIYKLPQEGNNTPATLTLTLAGGTNTSAITILRQGGSVTKHYPAGSTILLVYDGTYWRTDGDYNSDRYISSIGFSDDTTENSSAPLQIDLYVSDTTATITGNLPKVSSDTAGVVPKGTAVTSQSQSTKFLREDGTWAAPSYSSGIQYALTIGSYVFDGTSAVTIPIYDGSITSTTRYANGDTRAYGGI